MCVYTDAGFSGGRGISVFTTPEIAREFVRVLGRGVVEGTNGLRREDPTYLAASMCISFFFFFFFCLGSVEEYMRIISDGMEIPVSSVPEFEGPG